MQPLAQPPQGNDPALTRWLFLLWKRINSTAGMAWSLIDKTGSNLTDLETRNHADLQNINTATYTHLSATNHTDLTDGGATTLHKHDHATQDNLNSTDYTHLTAANHTDLTDAGDSALHYHATDRNTDNHTSGTTNKVFTATEQTKLAGIATGAEVNVNSDWTSATGDSQILNKPTLGTAAAANLGTGAGDAAYGNHTHSGVYEPADATILKDADIGSTVQAYDADIPTVSASQVEMEAGTDAALRSMSPLRIAQAIAALGSGGVTNHALLSNLAWTSSAHTGTASKIAGFSGAGAAAEYTIGTGAGEVAAGDHNHTGVYEPADATILKDADIGVSVQAYDEDIATVSASQAEMESGTEAALRSMSPLRVAQAIAALGGGGSAGPAFRAYATGTTSITGGGYTKVALAGENVDTANAFDSTTNYRFQPAVAGYYQINASVYFASASYTVAIQLRKNGSGVTFGGSEIPTHTAACGDLIYMNGSTDYLELFAYSATTQNASASQSATYMSGHLARAA